MDRALNGLRATGQAEMDTNVKAIGETGGLSRETEKKQRERGVRGQRQVNMQIKRRAIEI